MKPRVLKTKAQMLELGLKCGGDPNGHWWITRNGKVIKSYITSTPHPYGKPKTYRVVGVYVKKDSKSGYKPGSSIVVMEHVVCWIWWRGDIPDGDWQVDHIDGQGKNNHLYNLRLISAKDNLQARGCGRNQYTGGMTDEQILAKREEKKESSNTGKFGHRRGRPSKKLLEELKENQNEKN